MPDLHTDNRTIARGQVLLCEDFSGCRLTLSLLADGLECLATIETSPASDSPRPPSQLRPSLAPADLLWSLYSVNIVTAIDYPAVYTLCADLELTGLCEPTVVARGTPPVQGAAGWFELLVKTGAEGISLVADDKGVVDHKKLNLFSEIEVGQKLGIVHPPAPGTPGTTVQGQRLAAPPGEPYHLTVQEGVDLKYGDRVAFAQRAGKVIYKNDALAVVDYWIIPGDLDLSIGNINFHGFIEIKGDIPDDFRVVADKGMKIHGHVGAAHIESDGSIELASMAGKGIGSIICRGDLRAKYLNQVKVFCFGNVFVASEVRNCLLKSNGAVIIKSGVLLGGECVAFEGVEVKVLGSEFGVPTTVIAGIYFPDSDRFDFLRQQRNDVAEHLDKVSDALRKIRSSMARNVAYAELAEKRMKILTEQFNQLVAEKNRFSAEIAASQFQQFAGRNAKINVHSKVMEEVSLVLGNSHEKIKVSRNGPVSIIENSHDGGLRFLSLSPLAVLARDMEDLLIAASGRTATE